MFERLFALLNDPENEANLIEASEEGRPALEGIVDVIETDPEIRAILQTGPDGYQFRMSVGFAIRVKMAELGWDKDGTRTAEPTDAEFFTSSQLYP